MTKPDSSSRGELTVNDALFWLLWQCTNRSMIDLTADKKVTEFVEKANKGVTNLIDTALQTQADKMLECLPEKQDPLAPDTMFDEVLGFNQALDLCRQAIKEQMKGRK